jgi:hypothetical protein
LIDTVFWNTVGLGSWARATIALLSLADISSNRALLAAPQLTTTTSPLTVSGSPSRSSSTAFTVRPDSSVTRRFTWDRVSSDTLGAARAGRIPSTCASDLACTRQGKPSQQSHLRQRLKARLASSSMTPLVAWKG